MVEGLVQTTQYFPECFIIIDHLADGMQHVGTFIIHVAAGAFCVYAIRPDNGNIIGDLTADALYVCIGSIFSILAF
ncbi:hypothetical protein D9M68_932400 [compost metagenome]